MHHKILVGINSSPSARHALACTMRYAGEVGAQVVGLLVETPFAKAPRYGREEFQSAVRINAERLARQYGVSFEFRTRRGYPARTIAEQARLLACDLVVLGHADDSPFHRWLTASVSDLVRHQVPCRVLVMRTGDVITIGPAVTAPEPTLLVTALDNSATLEPTPTQAG